MSLLHILRNPYGFSEAEIRKARLEAADLIETLAGLAWRNSERVMEAKALATAEEIAHMWGSSREQFVTRIQVAVLDAMRWAKEDCDERTST